MDTWQWRMVAPRLVHADSQQVKSNFNDNTMDFQWLGAVDSPSQSDNQGLCTDACSFVGVGFPNAPRKNSEGGGGVFTRVGAL